MKTNGKINHKQNNEHFYNSLELATCYLLLATCYLLLATCYVLATCYLLLATILAEEGGLSYNTIGSVNTKAWNLEPLTVELAER